MSMTARALTVRDVAKVYGVTAAAIYKYVRDGKLRGIRLGGPAGPYRFRQSDLDAFEARCRAESSPAPSIVSDSTETGDGISTGRMPNLVTLDPFQRGRLSARRPRNGETNG